MIHFRIKAGALYYVTGIAAIIALLLVSFITLNRLQQLSSTQSSNFKETIYTNQQSFRLLQHTDIGYQKPVVIESPTNASLQTTLLKKHWGVFDVLLASSQLKNEHFKSVALVGITNEYRNGLYLSDHKRPLVVVGTTRIEGNAKLPQKGMKTGTIGGQNYYNQKLLYGRSTVSTQNLPKLKNRDYLQQITNEILSEEVNFEYWGAQTRKPLSFWQATKIVYAQGSVDLEEISLSGNYIVQSENRIRVFKTSKLKDVILIAPIIEILDGVQGNFQAFASRELTVGKNCRLQYPTALVFCEGASQSPMIHKNLPNMQIQEGTSIQGALVYISDEGNNSHRAQLKLHANVMLEGELYCERNLDSEAVIHGTVYTDAFVAEQFGAVYQNHLYNCSINAELLPAEYAGLFIESQETNIVKWLY